MLFIDFLKFQGTIFNISSLLKSKVNLHVSYCTLPSNYYLTVWWAF